MNARPVPASWGTLVQTIHLTKARAMKDSSPKMFEALACGLLDNGVTTLFGLIGDANLFMVESYQ